MISVLIPVYNWNIHDLAIELNHQCSDLGIETEIIFLDDCSSQISLSQSNQKIAESLGFKYLISDLNQGIASTLNKLANLATYHHLIFIDADVMPVHADFLKQYAKLNIQDKVYCGGLLYQNQKPEIGTLRWKYGKKSEVQSLAEANQNPHLNIKGCNFCCDKKLVLNYPFATNIKTYSPIDTLFGLNLKANNKEILFIENRVYHLGLDDNESFLNKTEILLNGFISLGEMHPGIIQNSKLFKLYAKFDQLKLTSILKLGFKIFKPFLRKNLLSKNPSTALFQIYKLGYLSTLKFKS